MKKKRRMGVRRFSFVKKRGIFSTGGEGCSAFADWGGFFALSCTREDILKNNSLALASALSPMMLKGALKIKKFFFILI